MANTFFNNVGPSPHIEALNYEGVKAPYGPFPQGSYTGMPPGSVPIVPAFTGASFKGSVKGDLNNYITLAMTHYAR